MMIPRGIRSAAMLALASWQRGNRLAAWLGVLKAKVAPRGLQQMMAVALVCGIDKGDVHNSGAAIRGHESDVDLRPIILFAGAGPLGDGGVESG